ncbi:MAG: PAS domain-containing protein, partial [Longimicrobiales bacterium]
MAMSNDSQQAAEDVRRAKFLRRINRVTPAACSIAIVVSALTLLGWATGNQRLVRVFSDGGAMVPIAALGVLACALSLLLLHPEQGQSAGRRRAGRVLAGLAALAGLTVAIDYVSPARLQFDLLLFPQALLEFSHGQPPRPSPLTAINLFLTGCALLLLNVETRRGFRPAQILALLAGLIAAQTLISYMYDRRPLLAPESTIFQITPFNTMAVQTALAFGVLSLGILYARPLRGLIASFNGDNPGSYLARRLFPAVIVAPFVVGWLGVLGQRSGLYDADYALSFVVMMTILLMMMLVAWLARALRRLELERRKALQISRENEAQFRAIFENAGLGIGVVSREGRVVRSNRALQDMLGYSADELAALQFSQFTHADDVEADVGLYGALRSGEIDSYRIEKRYIRKDGSVIWGLLTTSVARDEAGRPSVYIGTVTDISEAREAVEAQRRFTVILEATPDFVGMTDAHGNAIYLNRAGREMVGLGDEDLDGLTIPDFHPQAESEQMISVVIPIALRDGVWEGETAIVRYDGVQIPVSQVVMAHRAPSGEVEYLSTVIRDISERRRLETTQEFLLEASRTLSASLELEAVLQSVLDMSVPSQGDYCVIDLIAEGGTVARAAMKHRDPAQQQLLEQVRRFSPTPASQEGVPGVLRMAQSFMANDLDALLLRKITQNEEHYRIVERLHPTALLIV